MHLESEASEVIDCIHQGMKVGRGIRQCCGGKEVEHDLYQCRCEREPAEYCLAEAGKTSLVAIDLGTGSEIRHVAFCGNCVNRVRP